MFNNIAELFTAQGRSFGAVMPKLASRLEEEGTAVETVAETPAVEEVAEVAPEEVPEKVPEEVKVAAVEPVKSEVESEPEIVPEEVTVSEFVEETVDSAVAKTPPECVTAEAQEIEIAAVTQEAESAEIEIVVEAPEPEPEEIEIVVQVPDAESEEIEIVVEAPEPEPEEIEIATVTPEPEEVAKQIVEAEEEQAAVPDQGEAEQEAPIVEQVVAALEPEPVPEDLLLEQETSETGPAPEEDSEWAKIDAALDMQDEMGASASDTLPEGDAAEMRFELAGVIIDGSSIYSARELLPVYRHFLGSEVSVNDLYSISHAITRRYAAEGYAAATAVVPTQSIQSGVATIRIEESFLGDIIVVD